MSLIAELQRRNVFRVAAAYLALGWVVAQVTGLMVPALHLPESVLSIVVWIGVAAFPFVLLFSWAFEITPEGLKREKDVTRDDSITHLTAKKLDVLTIGIVAVAIGLFLFDRFVPRDVVPAEMNSRAEARPTARPTEGDSAESTVGRASARQEPAPAVTTPDDKSIAVLPFVNMSEDKANEYFSDGISEELLNLLARIPELKVIARTSSFAFKGKEADIAEIAAKLQVAHILEGSVRKSGNTVRVTAQLVRTADSVHLWSSSYDRELADVFAIQDEIASKVVEQLKITLLGEAPKVRQVDPKAYALYLQALALGRQYTPQGYDQSNALHKQVLAIDPDYAPAWRGLSVNYSNQAIDGLLTPDEARRLAREATDKALAADPGYAAALSTRGVNRMNFDFDMAGAAQDMQRALELDPSDLNIVGNAAVLLQNLGRQDQAIAVGEYVIARDPVSALAHGNLASSYINAGRLDETIAESRTTLSLSPGYVAAEITIGIALLLKGDHEGALAAMQREAGDYYRLAGLAMVQHTLGQTQESDRSLAELQQRFGAEQSPLVASVHAWRGDNDQAFAWLEKGRAARSPTMVSIASDPMLRPLHTDPRWEALLRSMGMAPEQLAAIRFEVPLAQDSAPARFSP